MDCNKDEAIRAKEIAENKMQNNDFEGARRIGLMAQQLFPELENINQLLTSCDVHCAAQNKIFGSEKDFYSILQLDKFADEAAIKKQIVKLALTLHPDNNKLPGAAAAFKLVGEARELLLDPEKKVFYDRKCKVSVRTAHLSPYQATQNSASSILKPPSSKPMPPGKAASQNVPGSQNRTQGVSAGQPHSQGVPSTASRASGYQTPVFSPKDGPHPSRFSMDLGNTAAAHTGLQGCDNTKTASSEFWMTGSAAIHGENVETENKVGANLNSVAGGNFEGAPAHKKERKSGTGIIGRKRRRKHVVESSESSDTSSSMDTMESSENSDISSSKDTIESSECSDDPTQPPSQIQSPLHTQQGTLQLLESPYTQDQLFTAGDGPTIDMMVEMDRLDGEVRRLRSSHSPVDSLPAGEAVGHVEEDENMRDVLIEEVIPDRGGRGRGDRRGRVDREAVEGEGVEEVRGGRGGARKQKRPRRRCGREGEHWELESAPPGGPQDISLLYGFAGHRALQIWEDPKAQIPMDCHSRMKALQRLQGVKLGQNIANSGLAHLPCIMFERHDHALITAFVERWHPETNSFHLPDGELTITLDDVSQILGIPCTGEPVRFIRPEGEAVESYNSFMADLTPALDGNTSYNLKRLWEIIQDGSLASERRDAAILGYILACTLFIDKTGTLMMTGLVDLFADFKRGRRFAWGPATLAYLYRQLGIASRVGTMSMCGCLTLLETWIYDHFPTFQTGKRPDFVLGNPRAAQWKNTAKRNKSVESLIVYRRLLDRLQTEHVLWTPYGPPHTISMISYYVGTIRFLDTNEAYMPERVTRQFGRIQGIPQEPMETTRCKLCPGAKSYIKEYGPTDDHFRRFQRSTVDPLALGQVVRFPGEAVGDYMEWFRRVSRLRIENPNHAAIDDRAIDPDTRHTRMIRPMQDLRRHEPTLVSEWVKILDIN